MSKRTVGARHQQIIGKSYQFNTAGARRDPFDHTVTIEQIKQIIDDTAIISLPAIIGEHNLEDIDPGKKSGSI